MILIIDTSYSNLLSLGIVKGNFILSTQVKGENSFKLFWDTLGKLLDLSKSKKDEINIVSVSIGPGPFTALRNGISIARTISQIKNIPIVKFSLTEVIEEHFKNLEPSIIFDGRAKKLIIKRHKNLNLELIKIDELKYLDGNLISVGCKEILKNSEINKISINYEYLPIEMIFDTIKTKIENKEFYNFNEVLPIYHK
ncbi:MAG: hypothetical protein ACP5PT_02220 [Brevinematia bacterium]|jgi:tRNA A37 threonylcarbamoyladenosine modification protein TsaB